MRAKLLAKPWLTGSVIPAKTIAVDDVRKTWAIAADVPDTITSGPLATKSSVSFWMRCGSEPNQRMSMRIF